MMTGRRALYIAAREVYLLSFISIELTYTGSQAHRLTSDRSMRTLYVAINTQCASRDKFEFVLSGQKLKLTSKSLWRVV
ncbi:hypothetical protein V1521DRAFT_423634 [Lipomyces starkeyi]